MAVFAYKALDRAAAVRGTVVADTPRAARDVLRGRGLTIQAVELARHASPLAASQRKSDFAKPQAAEKNTSLTWWQRQQAARQAPHVTGFTRELSTLLGVGIPLLESIDTLARQHRGPFAAALLVLRDRVAAGSSLADAMRQQPGVFDEMTVTLTEVGESAGTLDSVLERLAEFKERSAALKNRIGTALIYPGIVLTMAVVVSLFLMTFVVPQLLTGLLTAGRPLPFSTRVVKAASDLLVQWWWLLLILIAGLIAALSAVLRTPRGLLAWHRLQLRLPILGGLIRKQAIVRISVVMATLLKSGVVFVTAVRIARRATPNLVMAGALGRAEEAVQGGRDISAALEATGAFPPLVVQIFGVGQQSGRLEEMLERLARDYDAQVALAATRFTAVLEPALILFLVAVVGFIAFATVMPILEAGNVL